MQHEIRTFSNEKRYGVSNDNNFKPRVYTVVLSYILKEIAKTVKTNKSDFKLCICNDFDGHQAGIIELLNEKCVVKEKIFNDLDKSKYLFQRHAKNSKIQQISLQLHRGNWMGIIQINISKSEVHNLIAKNKFKKERW